MQENNVPMNSEEEFIEVTGQSMLLLEKYKLKTNFLGCNMTKEEFKYYFHYYSNKTHTRLSKVIDKMQQVMKILRRNITYCEIAELRAMNNCIRNYRRRIGQFAELQPTKFSYAILQKDEEMLYNIAIRNQVEDIDKVKSIRNHIQKEDAEGMKSLQDKVNLYSQKFKTPYTKLLDIIDETQAECSRYYDNFERSMYLTMNNIHSNLDKFNDYINKWQTQSSVRAYAAKSKREEEFQEKLAGKNRIEKTQEQLLEELTAAMNKCLPFSPMREQYQRRIQGLRKIDQEKKRRQNRAGNMSNKRRNQKGIMKGTNKNIRILDWYQNYQNEKIQLPAFPKAEQFYKTQLQNDKIQDQHHMILQQVYRDQKQKKEKTKPSKQEIVQKYVPAGIQGSCWIDNSRQMSLMMKALMGNYTQNLQNFDLYDFPQAIIHKRVEFENDIQIYLQEKDEKRRREAAQKQRTIQRQDRRNHFALNIGYKSLSEKEQLDYLISKQYSDQFLPVMTVPKTQTCSQKQSQEIKTQINKQIQTSIASKGQLQLDAKNEEFSIRSWMVRGNQQKSRQDSKQTQTSAVLGELFIQKESPKTQLQQLTETLFKQVERKSNRNNTPNSDNKPITFTYFPNHQQIDIRKLNQMKQHIRIFIICEQAMMLIERHNTYHDVGRIKASIFITRDSAQEEQIKKSLQKVLQKNILTFTIWRNTQTYHKDQLLALQIGLVLVYSKGKDDDEQLQQQDFQQIGAIALNDYQEFFINN